ncbi:MAG TPA: spore maturation protein, partial [Clostridium sp.]|nr:spore maturation protein [Clostridium sp.]
SRVLTPILKLIFKDAAKDEKAMGAITMNLTANMFGLGNAATPFGIKAMEEMERLNMEKGRATNDMVLFLILNAACIQFIPTTVVSIRAAANSQNPGAIILAAFITTFCASLIGIVL